MVQNPKTTVHEKPRSALLLHVHQNDDHGQGLDDWIGSTARNWDCLSGRNHRRLIVRMILFSTNSSTICGSVIPFSSRSECSLPDDSAKLKERSITNPQGDLLWQLEAYLNGSMIAGFDEGGMTLFSKARGSGPKDGLLGFSGSTVTAHYGSIIYTYD
jgi:hypothetical protein